MRVHISINTTSLSELLYDNECGYGVGRLGAIFTSGRFVMYEGIPYETFIALLTAEYAEDAFYTLVQPHYEGRLLPKERAREIGSLFGTEGVRHSFVA